MASQVRKLTAIKPPFRPPTTMLPPKGYMKDDYVHLFVRRHVRRAPIINRGYFARWAALRKLLFQFLDAGKELVLIQPTFNCRMKRKPPYLYVELDFKEVTSKKASLINTCPKLRHKIGENATIMPDEGQVLSDSYKLLPVDLRDIPKLDEVIARDNIDPGMPTFIIAECVLIYLDPDSSRNIVSWASRTFSTSIFFLYEQILPDDAFGQQMIRNLESRGCALLSLYSTPTLHAKEMLFLDPRMAGLANISYVFINMHYAASLGQRALAWDMLKVYSQFIDSRERRRIERLELFDEFEEWHMMQASDTLFT
ncbi:unnamed protein product [Rhodiola kirilowii]